MKNKLFTLCAVLMLLAMLVSACAPATAEPATSAPAETAAPVENTAPAAAPTVAEPAAEPSLVGGTMTISVSTDPTTLDSQISTSDFTGPLVYSSLIFRDEQGNYLPYLASSWEISEDGLTYTFHLREDVKFHNGDPLTAQDVVFSYQRGMAPDTGSLTATMLAAVDTITALDEHSVQFTLKAASYYFFDNLSGGGYMGIMSQRAVEEAGDNYGYHPVGTGPYIFQEWVTGDHITLVRNPDFTWGPQGNTPPNIETVIFRTLPDPSTVLAGVEAGEIDFVGGAAIMATDAANLEATGNFDVITMPTPGIFPYFVMNVSKPPFDDVRVRQALNYATDRQAMIDIIAAPGSIIQNGPMSPTTEGYWSGVETMGYPFDLEKAKELMQEAGYIYNAGGMLEKDGQPFSFEIIGYNGFDISVKMAEVVQSQWKELGVDVQIVLGDYGVEITNIIGGNYTAAANGWGAATSDMLNQQYHSKSLGATNFSQLNDPELDAMLDLMTNTIDPAVHLQAAADAQKRIVEQAYIIPLFSGVGYYIFANRIKDYSYTTYYFPTLWNAYIEE